MSRTISVAVDADGIADLDGQVVSGLEALRQRVHEAVLLRFGEWMLARSRGLDRSLVLGHRISGAVAAQAISGVIRREGGSEITALRDIDWRIDGTQRVFRYSVRVESIWGDFTMTEAIIG